MTSSYYAFFFYQNHSSLLMNEYHAWYKAFEYFGKRIEEESNGKLALEVYPSEQLAKESEAIRMIQAGIIDMTTTGAVLTNWIEIANFCEMPFLISLCKRTCNHLTINP